MLITDQLAITQPEALRRAIAAGVQLRNYDGRIYHPKVYLVHGASGHPNIAVLGSANLSESALTTSIEAGVSTTDRRLLGQLRDWFNKLFEDVKHSSDVDDALLSKLDRLWERAAAERARVAELQQTRLRGAGRGRKAPSENIEVLEDLFATIRTPIGILSFDHAGNNVRNLGRALEVLLRYPKLSDKERSELHLLGFLKEGRLTNLGAKARRYRTVEGLAGEWCSWIASQSDDELKSLNTRLASFKRAATQFWKLRPEVHRFFLENLAYPSQRKLLQTIELLCNGSSVVRRLSLGQIKLLGPQIMNTGRSTTFVAKRVREYQANKGSRSWKGEDRKTLLISWRRVLKR